MFKGLKALLLAEDLLPQSLQTLNGTRLLKPWRRFAAAEDGQGQNMDPPSQHGSLLGPQKSPPPLPR
eukprot:CAMPEP_0172680972 /NCGR_PEP_ID=MMETSP1074-20121228/17134_1 /TAXON_ID=2916 /ORGANISM="Ceratium fusus, Strain PA161109" /LENGTH=66 /DNA_ID=CAMNT_0013499395 /DNA_START=726 /DNA_END=923 /DNA_ORIENTATION=+